MKHRGTEGTERNTRSGTERKRDASRLAIAFNPQPAARNLTKPPRMLRLGEGRSKLVSKTGPLEVIDLKFGGLRTPAEKFRPPG